jgi:hypothetical protein
MTSSDEKPPWIDIAEQVSKEADPKKLTVLIERLCAAIDSSVRRKVDLSNRAASSFDS